MVVTGGRGYIGAHVVRALRDTGHDVVIVDKVHGANLQLDILDTSSLAAAFANHRPSVVFHLAATADARAVLNNPVQAILANVAGTASVLEAARQTGVGRVVLASTCWVAAAMRHGEIDETESFLYDGGGHPYTTSKVASELLMHDYQSLFGLPFTILRYGIPYGPGMWPGLVLRSFLDNLAADEPLVIYGDGSATRNFVYVEDLAQAHVLALSDSAENQIFNIEGDRSTTVLELASTVTHIAAKGQIVFVREPSRNGNYEPNHQIISNAKAKQILGWRPNTDLESGVRRTMKWYHDNVAPVLGPKSASL